MESMNDYMDRVLNKFKKVRTNADTIDESINKLHISEAKLNDYNKNSKIELSHFREECAEKAKYLEKLNFKIEQLKAQKNEMDKNTNSMVEIIKNSFNQANTNMVNKHSMILQETKEIKETMRIKNEELCEL